MTCKCILFDYGGTLDAPGEHWSHVLLRAWQAAGADIPSEEFRHAYVQAERALAKPGAVKASDTFLDLMRKKIALENSFLNHPYSPDICEAAANFCYTHARRNIQAVKPVLTQLSQEIPLGIVSNFYGNLPAVLADMGILSLFTNVTDSTLLGIRKPDPRIFLEAMRSIDPSLTPAQTLVVGDSIDKDILPASSAGFLTAHLPSVPWDPSAPSPVLPSDTIVLDSLRELTHLFTR